MDDAFTLPSKDGNYKSTDGKVVPFPYTPESESGEAVPDLNIVPFMGLVLRCVKNNIHDKEPVYVNVCHHTALLRAESQAYYMLSSPSEYVTHPITKAVCSVYRIVVHSEILDFMLRDKSGDARDQVSHWWESVVGVVYIYMIM